MKRYLFFQSFLIMSTYGLLLFVMGCAQIVQPTGGPKDEQPPLLDSLESTPNFQTQFTKQDITLVFDEFIELKDANNQIIVSPFTDDYEVSHRKKTVIFKFGEEPLKEDITYIINFGSSIVDYTAGNAVPNLRMVFSTGDFIDSLSFRGNVKDAYSGEPVPQATILVHEILSDTSVLKNKPLYIAKTDESGSFLLENMKADTFRVFAVMESRSNYIYEPSNEAFAFQDSFFVLTDSSNLNLSFRLSKASKGGTAVLDKETGDYGSVKFKLSNSPKDLLISTEPKLPRFYSFVEKDSLLVWYHNPDTMAWSLILQQDSILNDTIKIKSGLDVEKPNLNLNSKLIATKPIESNPKQPLSISFTQPVFKLDSTKFQLLQDSSTVPLSISIEREEDYRSLSFDHKWQPGSNYKLNIFPGAIESIHQRTNDSLAYDFIFKTAEDLSNLKLIITVPDSTKTYLLWLESTKEDIIKSETLSGQTEYTIDYKGLDPVEYNLRAVEEVYVNGQWDAVDYELRRQPERVLLKKLGKLLANFDREEEWTISFRE